MTALGFESSGLTTTIVEQQVRTILNEPTSLYWTKEDIQNWIAEACLDISKRSLCLEKTDTITVSTTTQAAYTAAHCASITDFGDIAKIHAITFRDASAGTVVSLMRINPRMVGFIPNLTSANSTGIPKYWYLYGDELYIYPTLGYVGTNDVFTIYYSEVTQTIADLPEYIHPAVIDYVLYCARLKEGNNSESMQAFSKYQNSLMFVRRDLVEKDVDSKMGVQIPDRTVPVG